MFVALGKPMRPSISLLIVPLQQHSEVSSRSTAIPDVNTVMTPGQMQAQKHRHSDANATLTPGQMQMHAAETMFRFLYCMLHF